MEVMERETIQEFVIALNNMLQDVTRGDFITNGHERECIKDAIDALQYMQTLTNAKVQMTAQRIRCSIKD